MLLIVWLFQLERERGHAAQPEDRYQASRGGTEGVVGWEGHQGGGWSGLITRETCPSGWTVEYSPAFVTIACAEYLCLSRCSTFASLQPLEER